MDEASILILGSNGQLGTALKQQYPGAITTDIDELDITNNESVQNFDWSSIKIILNAAAYTNVDGAETPEGRVAAWKVNATAVSNIAKIAIERDILVVHVSTDYVFDGSQNPHSEEEPLSPLGVYGQSKAAGDLAIRLIPRHYLLRTAWVIGEGKNFVRTMLELGAKGIEPTVVSDQIGRLTFTNELVRTIDHLLTTHAAYGTYNATNEGDPASWADITREIFRVSGYSLNVTNTTTEEYFASKSGIAPRPLFSIMDLAKLKETGYKPNDWRQDLEQYIERERSNS